MQLASVLAKVDEWGYDTFELDQVTEGRALSVLAFALIKRAALSSALGLDERKLAWWGTASIHEVDTFAQKSVVPTGV